MVVIDQSTDRSSTVQPEPSVEKKQALLAKKSDAARAQRVAGAVGLPGPALPVQEGRFSTRIPCKEQG